MAVPDIYGVIGKPLGHSLSPVMHNAAFRFSGLEAFFAAFPVADPLAALAAMRSLSLAGFSVTLPYKEAVMAGIDRVDEEAREIGAVNTIHNLNGQLIGYNTDVGGALDAISAVIEPRGRRTLVLGAGGAARALVYGLRKRAARVCINSRRPFQAEKLAGEFDAETLGLDDLHDFRPEIVINTTPLGMFPETENSPLPADFLGPGMVVMDIVYNPVSTLLLRQAASRGATTIDGLAMFVGQGARQFMIWTGKPAPRDVMRQAVLQALPAGRNTGASSD